MFQKLVAIEPVSLVPEAEEQLHRYAEQVILFRDIPADRDEIVRRIGDADAVLVSYTSRIDREVFECCSGIRYVGMCCSLYSRESANVDIAWAEAHGIEVRGIRDYGDRGVVEFVICELVRHLHGYDRPMWDELPREITGLRCGIVGMGVSGTLIAEALQFLGADITYFSRTRKPELEARGMKYRELNGLLQDAEVVFTCLNKNVLLLRREQFAALGSGKILFNTSIGPAFVPSELKQWLDSGSNRLICDTRGALGADELLDHPGVFCADASAGRTRQAFVLLSEKVLANIEAYLREK